MNNGCIIILFKDEVPASMMDAHLKNVEKTSFGGKFDPYAGLATSGIAGTGPDKDKEEEEGKTGGSSSGTAPATPGSADVEMKDVSKKDDGRFHPVIIINYSFTTLSMFLNAFILLVFVFLFIISVAAIYICFSSLLRNACLWGAYHSINLH